MDKPGLNREITEALTRRGARVGSHPGHYTYDIEAMKLLLEELCLEAGVRARLFTRVVAAACSHDRRLETVVTESKSGREAWRARAFVDATGDGDLAALAGCGFDLGHPGPGHPGPGYPETGQTQPMTFMALVCVRRAEDLAPYISFWQGNEIHLPAVERFMGEIRRAGLEPSYGHPTLFQVHGNLLALMVNHAYGVSALDAGQVTAATLAGRREVNAIAAGLGRLGGPWEDLHLAATSEQIGVREARRIHGRYCVTKEDLLRGARHPDAVCRVTFNVDIHALDPAQGRSLSDGGVKALPYDIPMRALIAREVDGLLLAGRCISGDFYAHASYRVTGNAVATGQAAGTAAALAALTHRLPHALPWEEISLGLEQVTV
jgi:hypothetical protein